MKVLVTRAEPLASKTVANLQAQGFDPILLPLFELRDLGTEIPTKNYDAYIFTSANALEVLAKRSWTCPNKNAVCFCVGETTAEKAREAGFETLHLASGGGAALAKAIKNTERFDSKTYLFPTTPDRSFDMAGAIGEHLVDQIEVYQIQTTKPDREDFAAALKGCAGGFALSYSARSARFLDAVILDEKLSQFSIMVNHVTISQQVAEKVDATLWKSIKYASHPSEKYIFEQLR